MEWFKFYYHKWLGDPKIIQLDPIDRLCFITLLCVTSQRDERNGVVSHYDERTIIRLTQLEDNDRKRAEGFTQRLENAGLVAYVNDTDLLIKNYEKRQNSQLSSAERSKNYRDRKRDESNTPLRDARHAREDKIRVEESREDKSIEVVRGVYGELGNVKLSEEEYTKLGDKLTPEVRDDLIDQVSTYIPNKRGKPYTDYYAVVLSWSRKKKDQAKQNQKSFSVIQG